MQRGSPAGRYPVAHAATDALQHLLRFRKQLEIDHRSWRLQKYRRFVAAAPV